MKMLSLFAAAAGLTLLGAAPPPPMDGPPGAGEGYPPCSRAVRDRCIQLYERGVASPRNLALNDRLGPGREPRRFARGPMGPMEPMGPAYGELRERRVVVARNEYRPCRDEFDDRCIQASQGSGGPAPVTHRVARVRYERELVRIGERG
jgi:hypothetical protein